MASQLLPSTFHQEKRLRLVDLSTTRQRVVATRVAILTKGPPMVRFILCIGIEKYGILIPSRQRPSCRRKLEPQGQQQTQTYEHAPTPTQVLKNTNQYIMKRRHGGGLGSFCTTKYFEKF